MSRELSLSRYRNIGIMAHIDAGKTTVSERILLVTGRLHRAGNIDEGNTALDWMKQEQDKGITITAAATTTFWSPLTGPLADQKHRINLIDTPGHVDFTIEVERSLRVLDGAVAVFDAGNGVEPQSETVWHQADRYRVPRLAFINKMDKVGADFTMCVESIRERLGARAIPVQLPLGEGAEHVGVIDLVRGCAYVFDQDPEGRQYRTTEIPSALRVKAEQARATLVEACAELDGEVLEHFLGGQMERITEPMLVRALRRGTLDLQLVPVLCGTAFRHKGIQMLLDAIVSYLPSPSELPEVIGHQLRTRSEVRFPPSDEAPLCALAFKLMHDKGAGTLTFLRVYSGVLASGDAVLCSRTGRTERIGRLVLMHANQREQVKEARAGMIVAAIGLRDVRTGDTLTSPETPAVLEGMAIPEPVLELAIHPRTQADHDRLGEALRKLALEDPSFRIAGDAESGETRILGMGELHLEILVDRLRTDHHVEARVGKPSVSFRETIVEAAEATYLHRKQDGGVGQYAKVSLRVAPLVRGAGFQFADEIRGGAIPREFLPAVEKGVRGAMERGLLAGHPLVDVGVAVIDGDFHEKDSSALAFEIAGSLAFQEAARRAGLQLLEPVMAVEAVVDEASLGSVIADLNARRGQIQGLSVRGLARVVDARVPLAELFGYASQLRSLCHGRGNATLRFVGHEAAPRAVEARLLNERDK